MGMYHMPWQGQRTLVDGSRISGSVSLNCKLRCSHTRSIRGAQCWGFNVLCRKHWQYGVTRTYNPIVSDALPKGIDRSGL